MKTDVETNKKTLLIVDDSTINLEMMSVMIGDVYDIQYATNGQKAMSILQKNKDISLILLDLGMPYMSGMECLTEIKKNDATKNIPVIVFATEDDNEAAGMSMGAMGVIKKPFPLRSDVLAKIEKVLNAPNRSVKMDLDAYINTLFSEYQTVYLIDIQSGRFESVTDDATYRSLIPSSKGENFFEKVIHDVNTLVYEPDRAKMLAAFEKESFIQTLQEKGFTVNYRLQVEGAPKHYRMKAMYIPDEAPQIMIGINCTDEEMVGMETLQAFREDTRNYSELAQAMVADYMSIYLVHLASNRFVEFFSAPGFERLRLDTSGDNFFTFVLKSILEGVNSADKDRVVRQFSKENVLNTIQEHRAFRISFRLMFEGNKETVLLKITKMIKDGVEYLVAGISNIDAQM